MRAVRLGLSVLFAAALLGAPGALPHAQAVEPVDNFGGPIFGFGDDGHARYDMGTAAGSASVVARDRFGLWVGYSRADAQVLRVDLVGNRVATFGVDGAVALPDFGTITALHPTGDGGVVVVGSTHAVRLLATGLADPTFNGGQRVALPLALDDQPGSSVLLDDGRLVVGNNESLAVLSASGDASELKPGLNNRPYLARRGEGFVLATWLQLDVEHFWLVLIAFDANLEGDESFLPGNGQRIINARPQAYPIHNVVVSPNFVTIAGGDNIYRVRTDGEPSSLSIPMLPTAEQGAALVDVAVQDDGALLYATARDVWRFGPDGQLDATFGEGGRIHPGVGITSDFTITRLLSTGKQRFVAIGNAKDLGGDTSSDIGIVARDGKATSGVPIATMPDVRLTEGSATRTTKVVRLPLDRAADTADLTVQLSIGYSTPFGFGTAGTIDDFAFPTQPTLAADGRALVARFATNPDRVPEPDERATMYLELAKYVRMARDRATLTITNDDFAGPKGAPVMNEVEPFGTFAGGASLAAGVAEITPESPIIGAGPGGAPIVHFVNTQRYGGSSGITFRAYDGTFRGGVRVATASLDGWEDRFIVTAPGAGMEPRVRVFSAFGGQATLHTEFLADLAANTRGLFVASADVDGDGYDEIVTSNDAGGAPVVSVWDVDRDTRAVTRIARFLAYDLGFRGGVRITGADVDGDGRQEVVTAAGPGGGPHVKVFRVANGTGTAVGGFMAYDPGFTGGVTVAASNIDADRSDELMTTPASVSSHVVVNDFVNGQRRVLLQFMAGTTPVTAAFARLDHNTSDNFILTATAPGRAVTVTVRRLAY